MKRNLLYKLSVIFTALCFLTHNTLAQIASKSILIKNATVLTVTQGTLSDTDILIRDGKIYSIGQNLSTNDKHDIINAKGLFIMPGIIDAHSHEGLDAINEATNPVTAEVAVGDALNPFKIGLYRALAGGVTTIHTMHGSANAIGGQCATIKLRYGVKNAAALVMKGAPRTIKFALGENPTRVHGSGNSIVPRTRMGVEFVIREALSKAKDYRTQWINYNTALKKKGFRGSPPQYNLRLETLADILDGKIIIHCHSYRADEIYMMLKICKEFGINNVVFQHVNEGFKVAPELAAHGAMASVFADWWAYKFEVYYSTAYNAAILTRSGVTTSINSDDGELMRHLYHEAAKTQKYGDLTDDDALALITINPAKQLGIANRVGSIEIGKDADLAIFKEHPLSIYAMPRYTLVDGIIRFNSESDPDDMRIYIDPKESIDAVTLYNHTHAHEACMQGAESNFVKTFGIK